MRSVAKLVLALATVAAAVTPLTAHAAATFKSDETLLSITTPVMGDGFFSGKTIQISAPITGETFVAGSDVSITEPLGRSGFIAGNTIHITKGAGYNLFAAGNAVTLSGTYEHDVYVAGSSITLEPGTIIKGDLRIAGSSVILSGALFGNIYIDAGSVTSNAVIEGNIQSGVDKLSFTGGRVNGSVTNTSKNAPTGLDKAVILGKVETLAPSETTTKGSMAANVAAWALGTATAITTLIALIWLIGAEKTTKLVKSVRTHWGQNLSTGVGAFFLVPIATFILFATIIGWKLGLIGILAYFILTAVATSLSSLVVGDWILSRFRPDSSIWAVAAVGVLVFHLLMVLSYPGWIALMIIWVISFLPSLGALARFTFKSVGR